MEVNTDVEGGGILRKYLEDRGTPKDALMGMPKGLVRALINAFQRRFGHERDLARDKRGRDCTNCEDAAGRMARLCGMSSRLHGML